MTTNPHITGAVILAAGRGSRMKNALPLPKVLYPVHGIPMLEHVVQAFEQSKIHSKPIIVVPPDNDLIQDHFGARCEYVTQPAPLGTGHAVKAAREALLPFHSVVVTNGDAPFITPRCINALLEAHHATASPLTIATVVVPDFQKWRGAFTNFGRIIRDGSGKLMRIAEAKDATPAERGIVELNAGYYMFQTSWLLPELEKLQNNNAQGEYYLTALVARGVEEGTETNTVRLADPLEALGINTVEQWHDADMLMSERQTPINT